MLSALTWIDHDPAADPSHPVAFPGEGQSGGTWTGCYQRFVRGQSVSRYEHDPDPSSVHVFCPLALPVLNSC